ncbi:MAG: thiamine phosphate synthase [Chitinivibrionales bacterium]|nr:thiamine phosphate synthase [Chitinivibrionales bacterium]
MYYPTLSGALGSRKRTLMDTNHDFGFYAILTDPVCGYEHLTRLVVQYGIAFVQLRMKDRPTEEVRDIAAMMREVTAGSRTRFIVNDFPEIAAAVGADGVHVGQNDMPIEQARRIVGPDAIIGMSTHNPAQTARACAARPDYIGVGPVFPTPTKKIPDPPIGIEGMQTMLDIATVPAVVLGSITLENLPRILTAGARNFSLVRPLNSTPDPEPVLREIVRISGGSCEEAS